MNSAHMPLLRWNARSTYLIVLLSNFARQLGARPADFYMAYTFGIFAHVSTPTYLRAAHVVRIRALVCVHEIATMYHDALVSALYFFSCVITRWALRFASAEHRFSMFTLLRYLRSQLAT